MSPAVMSDVSLPPPAPQQSDIESLQSTGAKQEGTAGPAVASSWDIKWSSVKVQYTLLLLSCYTAVGLLNVIYASVLDIAELTHSFSTHELRESVE